MSAVRDPKDALGVALRAFSDEELERQGTYVRDGTWRLLKRDRGSVPTRH